MNVTPPTTTGSIVPKMWTLSCPVDHHRDHDDHGASVGCGRVADATALIGTGSGPGYSIQNDVGDLSSPNAVSERGAGQKTPE